jgi:hypothetical protein
MTAAAVVAVGEAAAAAAAGCWWDEVYAGGDAGMYVADWLLSVQVGVEFLLPLGMTVLWTHLLHMMGTASLHALQ